MKLILKFNNMQDVDRKIFDKIEECFKKMGFELYTNVKSDDGTNCWLFDISNINNNDKFYELFIIDDGNSSVTEMLSLLNGFKKLSSPEEIQNFLDNDLLNLIEDINNNRVGNFKKLKEVVDEFNNDDIGESDDIEDTSYYDGDDVESEHNLERLNNLEDLNFIIPGNDIENIDPGDIDNKISKLKNEIQHKELKRFFEDSMELHKDLNNDGNIDDIDDDTDRSALINDLERLVGSNNNNDRNKVVIRLLLDYINDPMLYFIAYKVLRID